MAWFYLIINIALLVAAAFAGCWTRRLTPRRFVTLLTIAAVLVTARGFLRLHPEYEQHLLRLTADYIYFTVWEGPLLTLIAFGVLARLQHAALRRTAIAAVALLSSLFLWDSLAACRPADPTPATMDDSGVYRQATSYDCGPAAAVTMLRTIGLPVDESKIAALSLLREGRGVTVLELCRGLDLALQGTNRRAAIRRLDADSLAHCPTPFLAEVRRGPAREHCVVVLEVLPDAVVLGDPARGRYGCLRSEFAREWTGLAITAQPQP